MRSFVDFRAELLAELRARQGQVALVFQDLRAARRIAYNETLAFPGASLIKLLLLIHYLHLAEHPTQGLEQRHALPRSTPDDEDADSAGVLRLLHSDLLLKTRDLLLLMLILSDNRATNYLLSQVSFGEVQRTMQRYGVQHSRITHFIRDWETLRQPGSNPLTAEDIAHLITLLHQRRLPHSDLALEMLHEQKYASRIPFFLPERDDLFIAHKTGTLRGVQHDAGLVRTDDFAYVLVILTAQQSAHPAETTLWIAQRSRQVYDFVAAGQ